MPNSHVKLFIDKDINNNPLGVSYVHHNPAKPTDDDGGRHARAATGDSVRWRSRDDGGFQVEFKTESPFVPVAGSSTPPGSPGSPIVATSTSTGFETKLFTLKSIGSVQRKGFSYTVTFDSGTTDDPEVIIDNSSGGGGSAKKAKKKKK